MSLPCTSTQRSGDPTGESLMITFASLRSSCLVLSLGLLAIGCAAEASTSDGPGSSVEALTNSKVKLPAGDPCRGVLAPLALGLAEGSVGLPYASAVTVSLTSETDTRLYTVSVAQGAAT